MQTITCPTIRETQPKDMIVHTAPNAGRLSMNHSAGAVVDSDIKPGGNALSGSGGQVSWPNRRPGMKSLNRPLGWTQPSASRRGRWPSVIGAMAVISMFVFTSTASADQLPGLQRVPAQSMPNSQNKSVTATCPPTYRVLSASGEITGGLGQVILDDITPNAALTSVLVTGMEDQDGTTANWSITAYAICSRPIPGLQRESQTTGAGAGFGDEPLDPEWWWSLQMGTCTWPLERTGIGAEITGGFGQVDLKSMRPGSWTVESNSPWTSYYIASEDHDGTDSDWTLTGYRICAEKLAGHELVPNTTDSNSAGIKSVTASCPPGKRVIGAGAELPDWGNREVALDDIRPNAALTGVTATAYEDQDGTDDDWPLKAVAICAFP